MNRCSLRLFERVALVRLVALSVLSVPLALGGCGDAEEVSPDAAPETPDAAPTPDAPEPPVPGTIKVILGPTAGAEIPVLFFDSSGEFLETVITDTEGNAEAEVAGETTVVALGTPSFFSFSYVAFGVEPGSTVRFTGEPNTSSDLGSMTFSWPAQPGAATYQLNNGCNLSTTDSLSSSILFNSRCVFDGDATIQVVALDVDNVPVGFLLAEVPAVDAGTVNLGDEASWAAPAPFSLTWAARPNVGEVGVSLADARDLASYFSSTAVTSDEPGQLMAPYAPSPVGTRREVTATFHANQPSLAPQSITTALAPGATSLDVSDESLLPFYGPVAYDPARRRVSWTKTAGDMPDLQLSIWYGVEKGGTNAHYVVSMIPPEATSVTFPRFPEEYRDREPGDPLTVQTVVVAADFPSVDGYSEAIGGPFLLGGGLGEGLAIGERARVSGGAP